MAGFFGDLFFETLTEIGKISGPVFNALNSLEGRRLAQGSDLVHEILAFMPQALKGATQNIGFIDLGTAARCEATLFKGGNQDTHTVEVVAQLGFFKFLESERCFVLELRRNRVGVTKFGALSKEFLKLLLFGFAKNPYLIGLLPIFVQLTEIVLGLFTFCGGGFAGSKFSRATETAEIQQILHQFAQLPAKSLIVGEKLAVERRLFLFEVQHFLLNGHQFCAQPNHFGIFI